MRDQRFDLAAILKFVDIATSALSDAREEIDALNVYPVPDGDTGTNMFLTISSAREALLEATGGGDPTTDLEPSMVALSRGALLGARGNSGVILSQMLRAVASCIARVDPNDRYAAVFAIVWVYPMLQRFWFPKNVLLQKVWQLTSVSIAAQLGVLPISLFYFHQFPGLFFVSNLLIIPFLGILLGMGILVIALALLNLLPKFLVVLYDFLIDAMNSLVGWVAGQKVFIFRDIHFDAVQLVLGYAVIILLVQMLVKADYKIVR